jgi:hypothetical protein
MRPTDFRLAALFPVFFLFFSCAGDPGFTDYRQGMFYGSQSLRNGEYGPALDQFLRAGRGEPDKPMPLALAGHAAYMKGELAESGRCLAAAEKLDPNRSTEAMVIVRGYQALIAFREGRRADGMTALGDYVKYYRHSYPDSTYDEVRRMYESGDIDTGGLELLINHQMERFEKEIFTFF